VNRITTVAATCALALAILAPVAGSQGSDPSPSPGQSNADTMGQGASTYSTTDSTRTTTTTTTTKHAKSTNKAKARHATTHRKTTSASAQVTGTTPHSTRASASSRSPSETTRSTGSTTRVRARGARTGTVPDETRATSPGVEPPANAGSIYGPPSPESGTMESGSPDRDNSTGYRSTERSVPMGGDSRVELNTATREEIAMLPGMNVTVADKVIAARPFSSWNELLAKRILTPHDVARIQNHVTVNGQPVQARVDLNTATREELAMLPGLDYPTADKIIAARPFNSPADLVNRNVLNRQQWDRISDRVAVGAAGVENDGTTPDTGTSTPH